MENENIVPSPVKENKPIGALVGAIIVIIILIIGGVYLWSTKIQPQINAPETEQPIADDNIIALEESAASPDTMIDQLSSQSPSDELTSIEADVNATDLNSIDKELQAI